MASPTPAHPNGASDGGGVIVNDLRGGVVSLSNVTFFNDHAVGASGAAGNGGQVGGAGSDALGGGLYFNGGPQASLVVTLSRLFKRFGHRRKWRAGRRRL